MSRNKNYEKGLKKIPKRQKAMETITSKKKYEKGQKGKSKKSRTKMIKKNENKVKK